MTSGAFESVSPDFIWVNRETRQRRTIDKIEDLMASIVEVGLINPPVIKRDGELIAGERRWTAVKALGWTSIPVQWVDELDEIGLHLIEYEENVKRVDLPWQEQVLAVEKYHRLKQSQEPTWSAKDTANALGFSDTVIAERLAIAKEITAGNEAIASAPKLSTATTMTTRKIARQKAAALETLGGEVDPVTVLEKAAPLLNADFAEWAAAYTGPRFNMIHCDFPYGVNMHKTDQGTARIEHGDYSDTPEIYFQLIETLKMAMDNVVADYAHLMFWFSMDYYSITKLGLEEMGWRVNPFPLIWVKSDNTGLMPDAKRQPRRIYETAFFASRGDLLISRPKSNATLAPGREKEIHMNEKPRSMLRHFLEMFVDENTRFLDPTCGSANAVRVARDLGAPTVLGIERDPEFYNLAKGAFFDD